MAFLRNHKDDIAAMDLFTVPTASLRLLYGFFVIEHGRRHIVHFNATFHPTSAWVIQQLREAFPYDTAPRYLIFDRDFMHQGTDLWPISKGPSFGTGRDRREVPRNRTPLLSCPR